MSSIGPKKSLFKRPAWAAKDLTSRPGETTVFGRHQVFDEVFELEEKKRIRREAKAKRRAEKERLEHKEAGTNAPVEEREKKKRRISREISDRNSDTESSTSRSSSGSENGSTKKREVESDSQRVTRSTPKKNKSLHDALKDSPSCRQLEAAATKPIVIRLEDEDSEHGESKSLSQDKPIKLADENQISGVKPKEANGQSLVEAESEDSEEDEYMRALKKKAREKGRQQRLSSEQQNAATAGSPASDVRSPSLDQPHRAPDNIFDPFQEPKAEIKPDPEIAIMIKSLIPNSKPLIVNRRVSQPLQQVKEFWCGRQGFEPQFAAKVFFTFLDIKLFNSSTLRTALQMLKKAKGFDPEGSEEPSKGKIILEATTEEIYQERIKAKERKLVAEASNGNVSETEEPPDTSVPEPPKKDSIIINLKCQDLPPMPLRVRPHTSIEKIMRGFQHQYGIDPQKTCWLVFDGDRLAKEMSVEEAGFEEGDEIEVYPR